MAKRIETKVLQVWPKGHSYEYVGDGQAKGSRLRDPGLNGDAATPWRKGTPEEWIEIRRETVMSRRQAKKARRTAAVTIPAAPGRVVEVQFRANIITEKYRSVHVEATSTVGQDEEPEVALARCRDVVKRELLRVKGQVDRSRVIADDTLIDSWGDGD